MTNFWQKRAWFVDVLVTVSFTLFDFTQGYKYPLFNIVSNFTSILIFIFTFNTIIPNLSTIMNHPFLDHLHIQYPHLCSFNSDYYSDNNVILHIHLRNFILRPLLTSFVFSFPHFPLSPLTSRPTSNMHSYSSLFVE